MESQALRLSVVVPTRNRPDSVRRLFRSLCSQSLSAAQFEVILVDDGSEPPVDVGGDGEELPFKCRIIYRDAYHGAHASRWAGLQAASGARVVFLDDDVAAEPRVLETHASVALGERIALGPILYPQQKNSTPFFRYMAHFYEQCSRHVSAQGEACNPGDYYICNSSGPRQRLIRAFEDVAAGFPYPMVGAGFDEALLAQAFAVQGGTAVFLPDAMLWHLDQKTLTQACDELRRSGEATGRVLAEGPFARAAEQAADSILGPSIHARVRRLAMRCFWSAPGPFLLAARLLGLVAEHGPSRLVPRWFCHAPLRLARWEGMRSVVPSFDELLRPLRQARAA